MCAIGRGWATCAAIVLGMAVVGPEFEDFGMGLVCNLCQQEKIVGVERGRGLPLSGVVLEAALEGDGVENTLRVLVPPDGCGYRVESDFRCGFLCV